MSNRKSQPQTATILASGTSSGPVSLLDVAFGSVQLPASMTGTQITIQGRLNGATWSDIYQSDGTTVVAAIPFNASRLVRLPDEVFAVPEIRFVSDQTESEARTIHVFSKS